MEDAKKWSHIVFRIDYVLLREELSRMKERKMGNEAELDVIPGFQTFQCEVAREANMKWPLNIFYKIFIKQVSNVSLFLCDLSLRIGNTKVLCIQSSN